MHISCLGTRNNLGETASVELLSCSLLLPSPGWVHVLALVLVLSLGVLRVVKAIGLEHDNLVVALVILVLGVVRNAAL